jgi:hypothetical protein
MVSDNEACHKLTAVIEFLTADQEPMGNIHKGLKNIHRGAIVDRSTVECPVKRVDHHKGTTVFMMSHAVVTLNNRMSVVKKMNHHQF